MTNKLQMTVTENKKNIHDKSNMHSQKLKLYVDEIAQIRKVLEDSNY